MSKQVKKPAKVNMAAPEKSNIVDFNKIKAEQTNALELRINELKSTRKSLKKELKSLKKELKTWRKKSSKKSK